jgi:hypothetical protein
MRDISPRLPGVVIEPVGKNPVAEYAPAILMAKGALRA